MRTEPSRLVFIIAQVLGSSTKGVTIKTSSLEKIPTDFFKITNESSIAVGITDNPGPSSCRRCDKGHL